MQPTGCFFILEDLLTFSMFAYIILLKEKDEEMVYLSIMSNTAELLNNLDKLHTTELGVVWTIVNKVDRKNRKIN